MWFYVHFMCVLTSQSKKYMQIVLLHTIVMITMSDEKQITFSLADNIQEPRPPTCSMANGRRTDGYLAGNHGFTHAVETKWWMERLPHGEPGARLVVSNWWRMEGYLAGYLNY